MILSLLRAGARRKSASLRMRVRLQTRRPHRCRSLGDARPRSGMGNDWLAGTGLQAPTWGHSLSQNGTISNHLCLPLSPPRPSPTSTTGGGRPPLPSPVRCHGVTKPQGTRRPVLYHITNRTSLMRSKLSSYILTNDLRRLDHALYTFGPQRPIVA
jgi:hypothetical protein